MLINGTPYDHAFLYDGTTMNDIGTLGGNDSVARSINDSGQIVGYSRTAEDTIHAFLYDDGVMTDIGVLEGTYSSALSINDAGQIVGIEEGGGRKDTR